MLTLFDVVIANEKATFKTDYGQIGHIPEGMSLMSITGKVRGNCVSIYWVEFKIDFEKLNVLLTKSKIFNFQTNSLFYLGDKLSAKDAFDYGLVTKLVTNTDDFVDELYKYCKTTASMSSQVSTTKLPKLVFIFRRAFGFENWPLVK